MGEIAHVDLGRLLGLADTFWDVSADVAGMSWPVLDAGALSGSSVEATNTVDQIIGLVDGLTADLDGWALAARASAEAFQHADVVNGERFGPR